MRVGDKVSVSVSKRSTHTREGEVTDIGVRVSQGKLETFVSVWVPGLGKTKRYSENEVHPFGVLPT